MASGPAAPDTIDALASRSEIAELLARLCHARDRRRWWLMPTVFHDDAIAQEPGLTGPSWRNFVTQIEAACAAIRSSHHQIGNMQIDLDGDMAVAETYVTIFRDLHAQVTSPVDPTVRRLCGGRYIDRCERRRGVWRIVDHCFLPGPDCEIAAASPLPGPTEAAEDMDPSIAVVARWRR